MKLNDSLLFRLALDLSAREKKVSYDVRAFIILRFKVHFCMHKETLSIFIAHIFRGFVKTVGRINQSYNFYMKLSIPKIAMFSFESIYSNSNIIRFVYLLYNHMTYFLTIILQKPQNHFIPASLFFIEFDQCKYIFQFKKNQYDIFIKRLVFAVKHEFC